MSDLQTPPTLPNAYVAHNDQATDSAAYASEMARLAPQQDQQQGQLAQEKPQQQAPQPAPPAQQTADRENMIGTEVSRLASTPDFKQKYGSPEAARQAAIGNLKLPDDPTFAQKVGEVADTLPNAVAGRGAQIEHAAGDIAYGLTAEAPKAIYAGIHGAVRSVLKMADDLDSWTTTKMNDWHLTALNAEVGHDRGAGLLSGYHLLSGSSAQAAKDAGTASEGSAGDAFESVANAVPLIGGQPKTVTGTVVKNVSQFITGMAFAGNQLRALSMPTNLASWAGRGVTAAQGFLANFEAFDGAQHRLSDLVQSVPSLRNPVTDFLSSKPGDTDTEGRLKNALEGSVLGQAADGVLAGLRLLRGASAVRDGAQEVVEADAQRAPAPPSAGIDALGPEVSEGEKAPSVQVSMENWGTPPQATGQQSKMVAAADQAEVAGVEPGEVTAKPQEQPGVTINFRRIDTSDDIKDAMQNLADKFSTDIDVARRGVQTFEQTKLGAQAQDAFKILMDRRVGQPLNDVESLAARQLWASSASKTMELANIAVESPTVENLAAFRKMLTTHAAIQEQVIAARTETARALSSWRIPASDDPLRLEQMTAQLASDQGGIKSGADAALALAQRVRALAQSDNWEGMTSFVEKSAFARTRDAVLEAWTNGLLTSPMTHVKVAVSNAATVALRIAERSTAGALDRALGSEGVAAGEASAQVSGLLGGIRDAFRFAGKTANSLLTQGKLPELGDDPLSGMVKAAKSGQYSMQENQFAETTQQAGAISTEALGMSNTGWLGKGIDYLGSMVRSPGRALTAEHDFFRSIGYRMELNAQATRQAAADVAAGRIPSSAMGSRISELIENPPPQVHMDAVNGSMYQTFTDAPGVLAQHIGELRQQFPLLKVILPFYKIPSRILSFTAERSPVAPLMSKFQQDYAAGGARQSLAVAQMGLGTAVMLSTADSVLSGQVTGSGPVEHGTRAALENEGWQPYSVKVGDKWFQYNRLETVGSSMAMAADAVEAMRNYQSQVNGDDPDITNLAVATTFAVANDITSKSYLQGLSTFFEAMGNPTTGGNRFLQSLAGSVVPAGGAALDRVTDPNKRAVYSMIDAIKARTPGLSKDLPAARNLWGEPIPNGSGEGKAFDLLSPFQTHQAANEPIDKELIAQGINLPRNGTNQTFEGVGVNLKDDPKMYARFQELAGNGYKGPDGLGLKDKLNAMVSGTDPYSVIYNGMGASGNGPDGRKAEMIKDLARSYRDGAKEQLLKESQTLRDQVTSKQQALLQAHSGGPQ